MEKGNGQRGDDRFKVPQYIHHTPLNAPRARVMEETLRVDLLVVVKTPTPLGVYESKYCRYHQNRGHTTEDCMTLKDKLESLVQEGHLRQFVRRGGTPGGGGNDVDRQKHNRKQEDRRSRSRSRDRTVRGVINNISGGFVGGGPTSSARKRHLRNLHHVNRAEIAWKLMPPITFSDDDFHVPDPDQDDLMVITVMIARYQVRKILVNQGSSANILYWKTFKKMDVPEEAIMPFREQIVGFTGERVDIKGYIDLQVSLGLEKNSRELKVRFLFVEADTSYNVLLGRPCSNAFGAIVSTPIWRLNTLQRMVRSVPLGRTKRWPGNATW
ncbi:uncharacterized protein LOC106761348 [Vigna radiata var. radiata]|uniref:Uncharacterized protein LOC106761348 n=1 Tax=Vigna radiata var. radiata TaxID=3916 RepID=A0A1S3U2Z5_VIGRR|nr:uncharacterized protein LOC106761348 [Vigna radiata var. radiata]